MAIKLKVDYLDDRQVEVLAGPKAQVLTERHFKGGLDDTHRVEQLYFLAWKSLSLAGQEPNDFDTFLGLIDDVNEVEPKKADLAQEDPTPETQPAEPSSP